MKKYILRYGIFWMPAVLAACLYGNSSPLSQGLQWFCAFFLIFGWCVNTAMAAVHFPRGTLSLLLGYLGGNFLLIVGLYNVNTATASGRVLLRLGGLFSFTPLDILIVALLDFPIPHEIYVTAGLVIVCFLGWMAGVLVHRLYPTATLQAFPFDK
jgi:hypothetical protein